MVANQEEREEGERYKWGRNSRSQHELDPWTYDKLHSHEKSWKKQRRRQYRDESRNKQEEHVVWLEDRLNTWDLEEWFVDNDIAYKLENVYEWMCCEVRNESDVSSYRYVWDKLPNTKPKFIQYRKYKLTWWSNKDIGIEYVLRQSGCMMIA